MSAEEISKAAEAKRACINSYPHWYEKDKDDGRNGKCSVPPELGLYQARAYLYGQQDAKRK